jgi:hypothetical protein
MNGEFEDLLRSSMDWFTSSVRVPSGLASRARQRHRRRRLAARAAIAAGAAAISAAAVIVATGGAGVVRDTQAQTAAYIIKRAEQAISTRNLIMEVSTPEQVITSRRTGQDPVRSFVPRSVRWGYHDRSRSEVFAGNLTKHGRPGADTDTENGAPGKSIAGSPSLHPETQTIVNLSDRTWSRETQLTGLASGWSPGTACALVRSMTEPRLAGELLFTSPSYVHSALACGGLSVTGHVRVDGQPAIRLTGTERLRRLPLTMYVSPATYLLVRTVIGDLRQDYRWLRPTAANLAKLKVSVPPGFRRVKDAGRG